MKVISAFIGSFVGTGIVWLLFWYFWLRPLVKRTLGSKEDR